MYRVGSDRGSNRFCRGSDILSNNSFLELSSFKYHKNQEKIVTPTKKKGLHLT